MGRWNANPIGTCPDCDAEGVKLTQSGRCMPCYKRKNFADTKGKEYIPYNQLTELPKRGMRRGAKLLKEHGIEPNEPRVKRPYKKRATANKDCLGLKQGEIQTSTIRKPEITSNVQTEQISFTDLLKQYKVEIPGIDDVLDLLRKTQKIGELCVVAADSQMQDQMLILDNALNVLERKLQHEWEYSQFDESKDQLFKQFLVFRRTLKENLFFWKRVYASGLLLELQKAWVAYKTDPAENPIKEEEKEVSLKKWSIKTKTTMQGYTNWKDFTRVFYAQTADQATEQLSKFLSDRNLRYDKSKTVVTQIV